MRLLLSVSCIEWENNITNTGRTWAGIWRTQNRAWSGHVSISVSCFMCVVILLCSHNNAARQAVLSPFHRGENEWFIHACKIIKHQSESSRSFQTLLWSEWPWLVGNQRETLLPYLCGFGLGGIWVGHKSVGYCFPIKIIRSRREGLANGLDTVKNAIEGNV